jgi:hypothetical protein
MIDLKRNSKKELVPASGLRSRKSSIYTPGQTDNFKISRSKFSDFLTCQRCFYLDRVKGLVSLGMPGWTLNETTDRLLKKEFDECRLKQTPHRLFTKHKLKNLVPFQHPDFDLWRDAIHHGLMSRFKDTNIILTGGVDDIWQNTNDGKLVIVDYKSQANTKPLTQESYLADPYHDGYRVQMDFYAFLLQEMGFEVADISYFLVCNANRLADGFFGNMEFSETLIPYRWNSDWIPGKASEMISLINQNDLPEGNPSCVNCASAKERAAIESGQKTAKRI